MQLNRFSRRFIGKDRRMLLDRQNFVDELQCFMSTCYSNDDDRWNTFIVILNKYRITDGLRTHLMKDFDDIHNRLIDITYYY